MPGLSRRAPRLLSIAGVVALLGSPPAAAAEPVLVPVHPMLPADHAVIEVHNDPVDVRLAWSIPREPVPVRFFVEVVAVEEGGPREVFASYVDQPAVAVTVPARNAAYAWRVYTVGRDVSAYALSGWDRFSVVVGK